MLNGILSQDFPLDRVELIIVDGCSKDSTLNILNKFISETAHMFNNVRLIVHDRNYGVSRARNDGIKASRGKYLLVLDHDVIMPSCTLKILLKYLESAGKRLAAVIPLHNTQCSSILGKWEYRIRRDKITKSNAITSCALMRRELINELGLYDESLGPPFTIYEDIEYGARALAKGYQIHVVGTVEVVHKPCNESSVHAYPTVGVHEKLLKLIKSLNNPKYRYALRKYLHSSPIWEKLRWIAYSILVVSFIPAVAASVLLGFKMSILVWLLFAITMYFDVLRQYWNGSVPHISFAYSAVAFIWRLARSTMLLIPNSYKPR